MNWAEHMGRKGCSRTVGRDWQRKDLEEVVSMQLMCKDLYALSAGLPPTVAMETPLITACWPFGSRDLFPQAQDGLTVTSLCFSLTSSEQFIKSITPS